MLETSQRGTFRTNSRVLIAVNRNRLIVPDRWLTSENVCTVRIHAYHPSRDFSNVEFVLMGFLRTTFRPILRHRLTVEADENLFTLLDLPTGISYLSLYYRTMNLESANCSHFSIQLRNGGI